MWIHFLASFHLLVLYLRGALWKVILNLLMILSFINNFSRSFLSHVIEEHQVSPFSATGLIIIYIYTRWPAQAIGIKFSVAERISISPCYPAD